MSLLVAACDKNDGDKQPAASAKTEAGEKGIEEDAGNAKKAAIPVTHDGPLETHPLVLDATKRWQEAVAAVSKDDLESLNAVLTSKGKMLAGRNAGWPKAFFQGAVDKPLEVNGGRVVLAITDKDKGRRFNVVGFYRDGKVLLDPMASRRYRQESKQVSHPMNQPVSIADATLGLKGAGQLRVKIATTRGDINCELYEKKTPKTVANFVALARGLRGFKLPTEADWVKRPFYTGLGFYQIFPGRKVASGCPSNDGKGGPGYDFGDEFDLTLRHDGIGVLAMTNRGPNTNGSQFYITAGATPQYDDKNTVFGRCAEEGLIKAISQAKTEKFATPVEPVAINGMEFYRKP